MQDSYRSRILGDNRFSKTLTSEIKTALLYQRKHEIRYGIEEGGKIKNYKSIQSIVNNWKEGMKGYIIKADNTILELTEDQVFAIIWLEDVGYIDNDNDDNEEIQQMRWKKSEE